MAFGLGLFADLLLRETPWGLNAAIWLSVLGIAGFRLVRRSDAPAWPLLLAIGFAACFAWRASTPLLVLCGMMFLLSISLPLLRDPLRVGVVRHGLAFLATLPGAAILAPAAVADLARNDRGSTAPAGRWAPLARGALFAVPFLLVFGALFSAADPVFEWYVGDVFGFVLERLPSHALMTVVFAWVALGLLFGLAVVRISARASADAVGRAGTETLVALLLVDALFLFFVLVQIRTLFAGREIVETTLGLSYAEYAREGFFQLVAAATVALSGLLAADWLIPRGSSRRRLFGGAAALLLALVALVLASAALRMRLYVSAYGLTELRLYTSAFMVWLAFVLVWFAGTVLRGRRERFMAGALAGLTVGILGLAALDPDATIVRTNAAPLPREAVAAPQESTTGGFDARYAATLGPDAAPALLAAWPRLDPWRRCVVAEALLADHASPRPDWRTWSWGRGRARSTVARERSTLERAFRACPVRLLAPAVAEVGEAIRIGWTGFTADDDLVSIAHPRGSWDETYALTATSSRPLTLQAPGVPGTYEIRYQLGESRRIIARRPLIVRPKDQPAATIPSTDVTHSTGSPTRISPSTRTIP
ncbi:MAG TPA: DUF4173 domain-containing protein [Gemmatimonadota bacterium]|nr:DUF4173 domain-containing protein [Gemmatimonadota bacterium]